ncbi:DUF6653 family protein [Natrinema marinum]|uniref:DUF6653 family protein n=1 Tax=Natrinema marinum TaxID=2961598 RepID=UPI0020C88CC2|nr:DUF6653 family protein [Natrinema marinum]
MAVRRRFWSRHANPWSVWTLMGAYPTLVWAIYRRDRRLLVGTLLFVAANPFVSPPPETDDAWATRVVLGERVWLEREPLRSRETLFAAASAPVYLWTLRAAVDRRRVETGVGVALSMALMLVFFRRMVRLYDEENEASA